MPTQQRRKLFKKWQTCICPTCEKKFKKFVFYTGPAEFPPYRCVDCEYNLEYNSWKDQDENPHNVSKEILDNPDLMIEHNKYLKKLYKDILKGRNET